MAILLTFNQEQHNIRPLFKAAKFYLKIIFDYILMAIVIGDSGNV